MPEQSELALRGVSYITVTVWAHEQVDAVAAVSRMGLMGTQSLQYFPRA